MRRPKLPQAQGALVWLKMILHLHHFSLGQQQQLSKSSHLGSVPRSFQRPCALCIIHSCALSMVHMIYTCAFCALYTACIVHIIHTCAFCTLYTAGMVHIKPSIITAVHITLACARKAKDGDTVITWGHTFMSHLEARIINMKSHILHQNGAMPLH